jgi:hypothetical protein
MNEMISSLTSLLAMHLNVNQNLTINTSAVFFSLEKLLLLSSVENRLNQTNLQFSENATQTVLLRVESR